LDLPQAMADPAGLAPDVVGLSSGLAVAAAGIVLAASLGVFIFERRLPDLTRPLRLLVRVCAVVLLVVGAALLEQALSVRSLGVGAFAASLLAVALAAIAVLAAARVMSPGPPSQSAEPATASPRGAAAGPSDVESWRWVLQLVDMADMTELQHFILERLSNLLHASGGRLLLADENGASFKLTFSTLKRALLDGRTALPAASPLVVYLLRQRRPALRLALDRQRSRAMANIAREMNALGAELVLPLISRGRLLAMAAFGPCLDAPGYAEDAVERAVLEAEVMAAVVDNVRANNRVLQEQLRTAVLLEQLSLGVIAADHAGTIIACNRAARRILGQGRSLEGQSAQTLGEALASFLSPNAPGGDEPVQQEVLLDIEGRGQVPVHLTAAAVRGPLEVPGRLLVIEDLSERRALETTLRGARHLASIGTLAAELAHEIRNPLVSIKTFTQLLPERIEDQQFQLKFAKVAEREVDAINRIVDRLLNFADASELWLEPVDLEALTREVLELHFPELETQHIDVEIKGTPGAPQVHVDRDKVRQVLRNVISNSVQAMPAGGRLQISTVALGETADRPPRSCRMVIRDSGCGIPESKLPKVFDPFYTTRERGFGLGLSLARHVMEEHGGAIQIESTPRLGTAVTLTFPMAQKVRNSAETELRA
jgi:signal transduction histidine kinase